VTTGFTAGSLWIDAAEMRLVQSTVLIDDLAVTNAKIGNLAVNDAKINDLSVAKITAGTLSAAVVLSGSIKTATSGARVEMDSSGIRLYSASAQTVNLDATTGFATFTGRVETDFTGNRIRITSDSSATGTPSNTPAIEWWGGNGGSTEAGSFLAYLSYSSVPTVSWSEKFYIGRISDPNSPSISWTQDLGYGLAGSYTISRGFVIDLGLNEHTSGSPPAPYKRSGSFTVTGRDGAGAVINIVQFTHNIASFAFDVSTAGALSATGAVSGATGTFGSGTVIGALTFTSGTISSSGALALGATGGGDITLTPTTTTGTNRFRYIVKMDEVYARTSASAGNMLIATSPLAELFRSTASSRRWKNDIQPLSGNLDAKKLLDLPVRMFRFNKDYLQEDDWRYDTLVPGFIAEEVAEIYPIAQEKDGEGLPSDWNIRFMVPAMLGLIQDLYKEIELLKQGQI
jgi:hypothetical protein